MKKVESFEHNFEGFWRNTPGKCKITIFSDADKKVVGVCSAVPENFGTSTTNMIEYIYLEISNRYFSKGPKDDLPDDDAVISVLERFIEENKTSKKWAIAATLLTRGWRYFNQQPQNNPNEMIWIDHWPPGIGLRPWEHELAVVKFNENNEPSWVHMSEAQFEEYTGIDTRLLQPMSLEEVNPHTLFQDAMNWYPA